MKLSDWLIAKGVKVPDLTSMTINPNYRDGFNACLSLEIPDERKRKCLDCKKPLPNDWLPSFCPSCRTTKTDEGKPTEMCGGCGCLKYCFEKCVCGYPPSPKTLPSNMIDRQDAEIFENHAYFKGVEDGMKKSKTLRKE